MRVPKDSANILIRHIPAFKRLSQGRVQTFFSPLRRLRYRFQTKWLLPARAEEKNSFYVDDVIILSHSRRVLKN